MLDIKNRKILTLFLSLSNCFFCHSTGSAPQTLSSHCQLPGLFHPGRVGNQSPEAEMKEGLTQGSWVEPLGLFLYTEKAKKCRTCSSVTSFCKEGTRTRRMMCRSHSSVHPCNTKDTTKPCWFPQIKGQGLLSSSLQPQDLQRLCSFLSGKEICTDTCSIFILLDKLKQMRTTFQALGFEESCV